MLHLQFERAAPLQILCLGAHSDDLEIGCGGSVLRFLTEHPTVVHWVVFGCTGHRAGEAQQSAESLLDGAADRRIELHPFRDAFFPSARGEIKEVFESLKRSSSPTLVFTHTRHDLHQDHQVINELTWNTFRDHLILEYEIPKFDGDLTPPNMLVTLDDATVDRKVGHLMEFFHTQRDKRWFDEETFRGLMRLRGVEAGVRYAEGFHCRKLLV